MELQPKHGRNDLGLGREQSHERFIGVFSTAHALARMLIAATSGHPNSGRLLRIFEFRISKAAGTIVIPAPVFLLPSPNRPVPTAAFPLLRMPNDPLQLSGLRPQYGCSGRPSRSEREMSRLSRPSAFEFATKTG